MQQFRHSSCILLVSNKKLSKNNKNLLTNGKPCAIIQTKKLRRERAVL